MAANAVLGDMCLDVASQWNMEAKYVETLAADLLQLFKKL